MPDTVLTNVFVVKGDRDVERAYLRIARAAQMASRAAGGGFSPLGLAPPSASSGGSSRPLSASAGQRAASQRFLMGPFQRQQALLSQRGMASAAGNHLAVRDIDLSLSRVNRQIGNLQPKGFAHSLASVLKTTRVGFGKDGLEVAPLAGRVASLAAQSLGPEVMALAGPVAAIAVGALAVVGGLFKLSEAAANAGNDFTNLSFQMGSQGRNAALAGVTGAAAGLSPQATAAMADSFNQAITGTPMGRMMGMKLGVFNIAGPYGNQDTGKQMTTALENLRRMNVSFSDKVAIARSAGLTGAAQYLQLSNKQAGFAQSDASTRSSIMGGDMGQKSADFAAALTRIEDSGQNLLTALGKPFLSDFTDFFNEIADTVNKAATWAASGHGQAIIHWIQGFFEEIYAVTAFRFGQIDEAKKWAQKGMDNMSGQYADSVDANTKALNDNTAVLGKIPGVYGKDSSGRLGNALPGAGGYNAAYLSRQEMMRDAHRLGAF